MGTEPLASHLILTEITKFLREEMKAENVRKYISEFFSSETHEVVTTD